VQICLQKSKYFTWDNTLDWTSIGVTIVYIVNFVRSINDPEIQNLAASWGAFAVLVAWLNVPLYLSELPSVGTMIHFSYDVLRTIIQMIMVLATPLIIGFGLFFHFVAKPSTDPDNWWYHDMLKVISMMLGNPDIKDYVTTQDYIFPLAVLNEAVICIFMIVMCLVIQNVLLTLTVSRMEYFKKTANQVRMKRLTRACESLSDLLSKLKIFKLKQWKRLAVRKNPKKTWEAWFMKLIRETQGDQQACTYKGKLYTAKDWNDHHPIQNPNPNPKYEIQFKKKDCTPSGLTPYKWKETTPWDGVAMPSGVFIKAEEIIKKRREQLKNEVEYKAEVEHARLNCERIFKVQKSNELLKTMLDDLNTQMTESNANLNTQMTKSNAAEVSDTKLNFRKLNEVLGSNEKLKTMLDDQNEIMTKMNSILLVLSTTSLTEKKMNDKRKSKKAKGPKSQQRKPNRKLPEDFTMENTS